MIELTLPFPPSVNSYKRLGRLTTTKTGKIYQPRVNTDATNRFYYEVWALSKGQGVESLGEALIDLEIDVYFPDRKRRDQGNLLKCIEDALVKAGCFNDDSQIARHLITRKDIIHQGKIIVRIKPYVT